MATNNKARIKQLEKTRTAKDGTPEKTIVMFDAMDAGELATFDNEKMTQAEAEAKAAALPDNVLLIRVSFVEDADA